jgi:hypothetical protein
MFYEGRAVSEKSEIVIEGFPRSANTFSILAFNLAQGRKVRIASLHVESQVLQGIKLGLPIVVLIRNPVDAIKSLMVRHPGNVKEYAKRYIQFYSTVLQVHEKVVLADFDTVTQDFGEVIRRVNEKFSTKFNTFVHSRENVEAVFKRITEINHSIDEGKLSHLAKPQDSRGDPPFIDLGEPNIQEAVMVYEKLISFCNTLATNIK